MSLSTCLAITRDIQPRDSDAVSDAVDTYRKAGMSPQDAQRAAVQDLIAEIQAEQAEMRGLVQQQHAALFERPPAPPAPPEPYKPRFLTPPEQYVPRQARAQPTYISRPLANAQDLHAWAVSSGIKNVVPPEKMHTTIAYSKAPIDASELPPAGAIPPVDGGKRSLEVMGDDEVIALRYESPAMQARWQQTIDIGATWDHGHSKGSFKPHVTISYEKQALPAGLKPYAGPLIFGPEKSELLQTNWSKTQELDGVPKQSRSLAQDAEDQQAWLNERARAMGYSDIDQLVDSDFDAFMALAEQWREMNPAEVMQARQAGGYQLPEFGFGSMAIEKLQNRYNRWKQTVDAVRQQGGVVGEASDFYRAEERYWGKVASRIEDFDAEVKQFIEDLDADKIDLRSMQLYAYAKHAKERNAHLRNKREANAGFDSWSGMSDEDADAIIDDARQAGMEAALDRHHQTLMSWTGGTRDVMLEEGLITDDQYLLLNAMFDNYVPLKGKPGEEAKGRGTGKGFNIRGKETERARGRYSEADNIIEHIIQDRVRALTRGGKNEVMRSFLQFVMDNPDPSLWEINAVETKPVMTVDDQGNQVIEEQRAVVKDDRTIGIKDGGREVFVLLKDEKLREQMQNMHVEEVGTVVGHMLAAQRMLGRLYTSLNPVFTVLNFARDTQAAAFGMLDEAGFRGSARLMSAMPKAMVESFRAEFGSPSPDYQIFRAAGGKTGFLDYKQIPELTKQLAKRVADAEKSGFDPRLWGPAALDLIERVNAAIENSTRFAAFKSARAEGLSVARAASVSKNITVNFNRKGTLTPQLSAFFLFFNPAVQGTARIAQALKSPKVLATLGAAMTGVAALALRNASMGDDDDGVSWWDKIPPEVKDRNLVVVLPPVPASNEVGEPIPGSNGRYVKIPMPYGWSWFATIANQAVDVWRNSLDPARGRSPGTAATRVASSFLSSYMPVQEVSRSLDNTKSLALVPVPDFINAPVQSILNINSFGRSMYPEKMGATDRADAATYFPAQAGTVFQRAAKGLNELTGGNDYRSGWLDFTPATLENLARAYGGGPASFALDMANAAYVRQSIARPDLDVRRLPFAKQLYGRIDAETDRMMGYERMDKISEVVDPINAAKRNGDMAAAREMAKEAGPIYALGGAVKTTRERLSKMREQELMIISSDQPEAVKYARLQTIEQKRRAALQDLNRAYNAALRKSASQQQ